jgi:Ca-activated chloride channel homolog
MTWKRHGCILLASLLLAGLASAQTPDHTSQSEISQQPAAEQQARNARDKIRVRSDLVVLSVTVHDGNGNLVSGLQQEDFQVFDDSVEQQITAFSAESLPLSLVILVDNDMKWKEGTEMTKSLVAIAGGLSATDEAMVCRYDMLFYPGDKFTSVSGNLIDVLKATQSAAAPSPQYIPEPVRTDRSSTTGPPAIAAPAYAGSRPSKALDDALYSAAELLQDRGGDRRKVILIVSDGANEPKLNHHTHGEVAELLLKRNVTVYSVAVSGDRAARKFAGLADYAAATGGDVFYATKSAALENLYPQIAEQARHDYTIAYQPTGNSKHANFHAVRVTAGQELTAGTRSGYYTDDSGVLEH